MLTDDELRDAWDDGFTEEEIAEAYGVLLEEVRHRRRKVLRLRKRPKKWVPTPEEIETAAALIREGWSETVRESRRVGDKPTWSVPVVPTPEDSDLYPSQDS